MPQFDANLTMLYGEHAFLDRFAAARADGFDAVEFLFPYEHPRQALVDALANNDLKLVLHNMPPGDWAAGERGTAVLADRVGEFQDSVGRAIEYATLLGCPQINCLAGIPPQDADPERTERVFVENIAFAAKEMKAAGVRLLIEAINARDFPGYYVNTTARALDLMGKAGTDNIFVQYDVYHMQVMEGDLAPTLKANLDRISHIQIADTPGRNEPGTGEINYPFLFRWLDEIGYAGWVGCEYRPAAGTSEGLGWLRDWRARSG